jgi:3-oxoacyl-[acyl-carrier protein] reductase
MVKADLSGKVALVTGSTHSIGKAIALKFADNNADVVVNGRNAKAGEALVETIERMGRRCIFEKADVTSYEQVQKMVADVLDHWGKIDIMVASGASGDPPARFFHETDPALYADYFKTRTLARLYCIKAVLEHMKQKNEGKIILVTSDAGRVPTPGESMIGASAAALVLMTKTLAREFARWKIHINTICTTIVVDTPAFEKAASGDTTGKVFQKAAKKMPFWPLRADDLAEMALFLASNDSDRITGQIFSVNGGLSFPG